jgi:hypothetical protein
MPVLAMDVLVDVLVDVVVHPMVVLAMVRLVGVAVFTRAVIVMLAVRRHHHLLAERGRAQPMVRG